MKFKVSLTDYSVSALTGQENITNNGQHEQLAGYALINVEVGSFLVVVNLCHPETAASNGHYDVRVVYHKDRVSIQIYSGSEKLVLANGTGFKYWPSGPRNLVRVCLALEEHLEGQGFNLQGMWNVVLSGLNRG